MYLFSEALGFVFQQLSLCHVRLVSFADLKPTSSDYDNRVSVRLVTRSTISHKRFQNYKWLRKVFEPRHVVVVVVR